MRRVLYLHLMSLILLVGWLVGAGGPILAEETRWDSGPELVLEPVLAKTSFRETPNGERSAITGSFPNLGAFAILEPGISTRYNCIAHSLGIHSRWVNPRTGPASNPFSYMDRLYAVRGYRRLPRVDFRLQAGVQKLALYATVDNGRIREITHAAVQERDGTWTSKLGKLPLIRHRIPQDLNGSSYGRPVATYTRIQQMAKMATETPDDVWQTLQESLQGFSLTPPKD